MDPKTGELKYSLGGQFVSTGAYVAGETFSVVTNVVEGDGIVTITIGGVEYDLPLVSTNTFEILSGMVFFNEGATKTIPVKMKGVVSAMLANAPAGWDAKLVGNSVQVTAPGESASEDEGGFNKRICHCKLHKRMRVSCSLRAGSVEEVVVPLCWRHLILEIGVDTLLIQLDTSESVECTCAEITLVIEVRKRHADNLYYLG